MSSRLNEALAESRQQQNRLFIGSAEEIGEFAALKKNNNNIKSKYPVEILVGGKENRTMPQRHKMAMQRKATITHLAFIFCN